MFRNPNSSLPILPITAEMLLRHDPRTIPRTLPQLVSRPGWRNALMNDDHVVILPALRLYENGQADNPISSGLMDGTELLCSDWNPETRSGERSQEVQRRFEAWVSYEATGRRRLSPEPESYVPDSPIQYPLSPQVPSAPSPSVPELAAATISTSPSVSWVTMSPSVSRHSNDSMPPATGMEATSIPRLALPPSTAKPATQWIGPSLRSIIVEILRYSPAEDHSLLLGAISSKVEDFRIANELPCRAQEQSIRAAIHHARRLGYLEHATASGQRCGSWRLTELGHREGGLDDPTKPPALFHKARSQAEAEGHRMSRAEGKAVAVRRSQRKKEVRAGNARAAQS